jgi:hypothetical protein
MRKPSSVRPIRKTYSLESRMPRKRARPVRRRADEKGAAMTPRQRPILPQMIGVMPDTRGRGTGEKYLNGKVRLERIAEPSGYKTPESRVR